MYTSREVKKLLNRHYLNEKSSSFDEMWYTTAEFTMADGRHIENRF